MKTKKPKYKINTFNYDVDSYKYLNKFLVDEKIVESTKDIKVGWSINNIYFWSDVEFVKIYEKLTDIVQIVNLHYVYDIANKNKINFQKGIGIFN